MRAPSRNGEARSHCKEIIATDDPLPKRGPGRPKTQDKTQVVTKLLEAAEVLLSEYTHHELTERKIATTAGINEAMIHYYFGGKDGLLFEVMLRYYDGVAERLKALELIDPDSPTVTRDLFKTLMNAYYEKHWITRMIIAEFARGESAFKDLYMKKFGVQGVGLEKLRRTIERLVQCGVYKSSLNPDYIVLSIFSMITGPFITGQFLTKPFAGSAGLPPDFLKQDAWIDHVADQLDRQLHA